ncbi:MAG: DinB family protein [Ignavibacteria bacterium]|nr:DinB family protein [Ignavibacteria bacterium]
MKLNSDAFVIGDIEGFSPKFSTLVCMMNYSRSVLLQAVEGLSAEQLDHFYDEKSNSIGMLLMHIAAVEKFYQIFTFEQKSDFDIDEEFWKSCLELDENCRSKVKGRDAEFYVQTLNQIRQETLGEFRKRDDNWFMNEEPFWSGLPANNWFKWFHVMEDEINHRGQINWLKKRLPKT